MRGLRPLLVVLVLSGSLAVAGSASAQTTTAGAAQRDVLSLLNNERAQHGLQALARRGGFARVARTHALDMVARNYFEHDTLGGANWNARVRAHAGTTQTLGENIGWGTLSSGGAVAMVRVWMNSPEHRRNILDPAFRLVGIGVARGTFQGAANARVYVTDFGG